MDKIDIEAAKRLKNRMWTPALKEFYEAEDVPRYFEDRARELAHSQRCNVNLTFIPIEKFFKKEVLKEGLSLIK